MHAIKRQARQAAWYHNNDPDIRTYNIWGRINTGPRRNGFGQNQQDIPLHHVTTENDAHSPLEERRRRSHHWGDIEGPPKSHTFPAELGSLHHGRTSNDSEILRIEVRRSDELDGPQVENGDGSKSGKRKQRKFPPWTLNHHEADKTDRFDISQPQKKDFPKLTLWSQTTFILGGWINVLLCFVPAGFIVNYTHRNVVTVFIVNFIAIIPLNFLLSNSTEEFIKYVGNTMGGLLSMSASNAVQLISSILLLKARQIRVLRFSLLGCMLQSLLLMTGLAFFFGGLRREEQRFNVNVAQTMGMFLLLAVLSLTVPTVSQLFGRSTVDGVLGQSRGTALIIIMSYLLWLLFQLRTHKDLFEQKSKKTPVRPSGRKEKGEAMKSLATIGASTGAAAVGGEINREYLVQELKPADDVPELNCFSAIVMILVSTTLLAFNTEFAVNSIKGIMEGNQISEPFLGITILPLLSNDLNAIACGIKDEMDLSILLTLHRSMQIALLVVPLVVLIAWGMNLDTMTLDFDGFSVASTFASIIIVTYVIQEGRSNWLTGALLIKVFVIVALASFYIE